MRKPIVTEVVRVDFQYRNEHTGLGLAGVTGEAFQYMPPGGTVPVAISPTPVAANPKTGAAEPGWFFVDIATTVEGTYRCMATCVGPSPAVIVGSFVVAPKPF